MNDELSFLHFNDVYHIAQPIVLGGLAHVFRRAKAVPDAERPVTIFSGDAFTNAVHADGRLLAMTKEYSVLDTWNTCLATVFLLHVLSDKLPTTSDRFHRHNAYAARGGLSPVKSCQQQVSFILGGHDHDVAVHGTSLTMINDAFEGDIKVIKSGANFRSYSDIKMVAYSKNGNAMSGRIRRAAAAGVDKPLFYSAVPLEGGTPVIWTEETNIGDMVADAVRAYYNADMAFTNSGSLRCNRIIEAGVVIVKDLIDVVPLDNTLLVKHLPGRTVAAALENAACDIIDS
ncbi:hypothetical protein PAXRUDRAFT_25841 [Paxillus rubicundulus Ve08.2h10]|uniref:5'-Nucleotidase C-terminal domain-containing protein n=1 Tax=Paxillus rubicundulus Ve08.2h10 TaxID=930991 RepID=A0A0D0DX60_9AGAM|nr:hypothetical protein PAXRUDRAFT_25841 [Paxillus rubicundulus Ve08.2h10]